MNETEFIGKVNRFGSEFSVYLDRVDNSIRIKDDSGNELKCSNKRLKDNNSILDYVPKILQSVGL